MVAEAAMAKTSRAAAVVAGIEPVRLQFLVSSDALSRTPMRFKKVVLMLAANG